MWDSSCEQHQRYYRALSSRDSRFDGVFFTGVKTTGIYCRPVCGVKTPKAGSCVFFSSAAAAEAAGFRPCLRCRPELAPYALQQNLAHAIWQRIAEGALNHQSVDQFAAQAGLSPRHLRRVLQQEFGVSTVELAQTQRLLFAKKLLQETSLSVTEIAYTAGFGSVRRLNALFAERYQLAPGAIRKAARNSAGEAIVLHLAYRPPYAWQQLCAYLATRALPGVEAVWTENNQLIYGRSVRIAGHSGWIRLACLPERAQLSLTVAASLLPVLQELIARVRQQFDLEANPQMIAEQLSQDPMLAGPVRLWPGLRVPGAFDDYELAMRAVLGQQVSVAGATTIAGRLIARFGEPADTPMAQISRHFPAPQTILALAAGDLAGLGMPLKRAATLQQIAGLAARDGLQRLPGVSLQQYLDGLTSLPGIGNWTAQYIAMRAKRFVDAFPAGDLGLQKAAAALSGDGSQRWSERQLAARSEQWLPWRSYAALLLWQSLSPVSSQQDQAHETV